MSADSFKPVFAHYAPPIAEPTSLREDITRAYRRAEVECLPPLLDAASFDADMKAKIAATARKLIESLRAKQKGSGVEGLIHEYSLSSQEGVALMCLAEALLRIPDKATRDALIRDKITGGDWKSHIGGGRSLFVNAATWGLVVTGKLTATADTNTLSSSLTRLIQRCGEPVIRKGVDMAMRMMGEQFVRGQTIDEAVKRAKAVEEKGFRYSYDMLGEAAIIRIMKLLFMLSARQPMAKVFMKVLVFQSSFRHFIRVIRVHKQTALWVNYCRGLKNWQCLASNIILALILMLKKLTA